MRATKNIVYATLIHFSSGHEMFYSLYFSSKIFPFYEIEKKGISFIKRIYFQTSYDFLQDLLGMNRAILYINDWFWQ